jgi:hypothetical protein
MEVVIRELVLDQHHILPQLHRLICFLQMEAQAFPQVDLNLAALPVAMEQALEVVSEPVSESSDRVLAWALLVLLPEVLAALVPMTLEVIRVCLLTG